MALVACPPALAEVLSEELGSDVELIPIDLRRARDFRAAPQIARLFARGETRAANSVYQAATLWSMIASWPLYLVLAGFAPAVMGVFGEGYDVANDVGGNLSLTMLCLIHI